MKNGRYSIGEISKLCCVSISKLRYYDEIGVIKPCFVDEESGYRYYDSETFLLLSVLKYYQKCGFKLKEITTLLRRMDLDHLEPMFDRQIASLEHQITLLRMRCDSIAAWRELIYEQHSAIPGIIRHVWYDETEMRVSTPQPSDSTSYSILVANVEMGNQSAQIDTMMGIGPLYFYFPQSSCYDLSTTKIYMRPHSLETSPAPREHIGDHGALICYHRGSIDTADRAHRKILEYAHKYAISLRGDAYHRSIIDGWSTTKEDEFLMELILPTTENAPPSEISHRTF